MFADTQHGANTVRDNMLHGLDLIDKGEPQEAKHFLISRSYSLLI